VRRESKVIRLLSIIHNGIILDLITSIAAIITCRNAVLTRVALLWVLETKESWQIQHDAMSTTTMRRMAMITPAVGTIVE